MPSKYPQEQTQKVLQTMPEELKTALFSEETAEVIAQACGQYGIDDERLSRVAGHVGDVLMGFTLPSEFEDAIRKDVDLPKVLVQPIAREISRFVFYPVRPALEQLHQGAGQQVNVPTPRHSDRNAYVAEPEEKQETQVFSAEQKPKTDTYRESLE